MFKYDKPKLNFENKLFNLFVIERCFSAERETYLEKIRKEKRDKKRKGRCGEKRERREREKIERMKRD